MRHQVVRGRFALRELVQDEARASIGAGSQNQQERERGQDGRPPAGPHGEWANPPQPGLPLVATFRRSMLGLQLAPGGVIGAGPGGIDGPKAFFELRQLGVGVVGETSRFIGSHGHIAPSMTGEGDSVVS